jgi:DNA-binding IclR family transcriptional regulator
MAVEEADEVVYVDVVEGPMSILQTLQRIGKRAPLHSTGVGKSLLLNYNSNEIREKIKKRGLPKLTDKTITSIEKFLAEIDKVRRQGYALDNEECETGVRCIAAPVRDYTGKIVCSISLSGPSSRFDAEKADTAVASIKKISAEISHHLGFAEGQ